MNTNTLSAEVKTFITTNLSTQTYCDARQFFVNGELSNVTLSILEKAEKDLSMFKARIEKRNSIGGIKIGDKINLPDGQQVMVCHVHSDGQVQTTGGCGSMHLNESGLLSYSGGLDSGVSASDLTLTEGKDSVKAWVFHQNSARAGAAVYSEIPVNVYEVKDGADLSGVPQVRELVEKKIVEQSETITRINGNGQPYTLHMPKLLILDRYGNYSGDKITLSGLTFNKVTFNNYSCQPMTLEQVNTLLEKNDFKATFYNNSDFKNTLILEPLGKNSNYAPTRSLT